MNNDLALLLSLSTDTHNFISCKNFSLHLGFLSMGPTSVAFQTTPIFIIISDDDHIRSKSLNFPREAIRKESRKVQWEYLLKLTSTEVQAGFSLAQQVRWLGPLVLHLQAQEHSQGLILSWGKKVKKVPLYVPSVFRYIIQFIPTYLILPALSASTRWHEL